MHFRKGSKGPKLILGGYSYFKNNGNPNRTYWLCSRNRYGKCRARLITMNQTRQVIIKNQEHNHEPESTGDYLNLEIISFDTVLKTLND